MCCKGCHTFAIAFCKLPGETTAEYIRQSCRTGEMVILGTQYAGDLQKGIYSGMHYRMPKSASCPCTLAALYANIELVE